MKIVSWNINGYRSITGQNPSRRFDKITKENKLFDYIYAESPDIISLQEIKASPEQIDLDKVQPDSYYCFYNPCKRKAGYSGVVTFSKIKPNNVIYEFGTQEFDEEGRIIGLDFDEFVLFNIYFPNGTSGDHRVDYKLKFYDYLFYHISLMLNKGRKIIVSGDYNTAHNEIDLARPKENENTSGFLRIEREKLDGIISMGFVDSFRMYNKEANQYTWWSQRAMARERNVGWRIDYHLVSENFVDNVVNSYHQAFITGSDHCPIVLELK